LEVGIHEFRAIVVVFVRGATCQSTIAALSAGDVHFVWIRQGELIDSVAELWRKTQEWEGLAVGLLGSLRW